MFIVDKHPEFSAFKPKVWLSSPTMHGSELEYMKEAFDTNWMSTVGENLNQIEIKLSFMFKVKPLVSYFVTTNH